MTRSSCWRLLAAVSSVAAVAVSAAPAQAAAQAAAPRVTIAITSVGPRIARPGATVTVSGVATNPTSVTLPGLTVQLWSSGSPLPGREAMAAYLEQQGPTGVDFPAGAVHPLTAALRPHSSQSWSLTLRPSQAGIHEFGVYPLAVELAGVSGPLAAARTFLPFWPGKSASKTVKPVAAAWVWPLIAAPRRAVCPALLNNSLAASLASGGRLGGLLAAGQTAIARQARLTWAIDPALVSDAQVMTRRYQVGGSATCTGATAMPASGPARAWYSAVRMVTATQDFFVTPYADVDVAALAHRGLNDEIAMAFADGRTTAKATLGRTQRTAPAAGQMAWPPDGIADYGVLEGLAASPSHVRTVILDSTMMPPAPGTAAPGAVASTPDGLGSRLNVLLADHVLTKIMAAPRQQVPGMVPAPAGGSAPGLARAALFGKEQWFLAETAMIAAEPAHARRSLVIAPPRRWDPPGTMADDLLAETTRAPWLRPASLGSLLTTPRQAGSAARRPPPQRRVSKDELGAPLLRQVRRLSGETALLGSILVTGGQHYLSTAIAAVQSSAWRGRPVSQRRAGQLLRRVSAYLAAQLQSIKIIDPSHVTLGGKSGDIPVSVNNGLRHPIKVKITVTPSSPGRVVIGNYPATVMVDAGAQRLIKIPVRAAEAGSTTLTLRLTTPDGRPLGEAASLTVEATHFGTLAIVIIIVALVVFVLTAAGRAFRRGSGPPGGEDSDSGELPEAVTGAEPAYPGEEADNVVSQGAEDPTAKEADEPASTPGRADRY